jgi:hypothetical protein
MNHRLTVDFVDPAPTVAPHLVQFAYSEDLRVAVIHADGAGYPRRVGLPRRLRLPSRLHLPTP